MVNGQTFNEDQTVNEGRNLMSIRLLIHTLIRRCSVLPGVSACRRAAVLCLLGFAFLAVTAFGSGPAQAQGTFTIDIEIPGPDYTFFHPPANMNLTLPIVNSNPTITITTSEPLAAGVVEMNDIEVPNGMVSNLTKTGDTTYTVVVMLPDRGMHESETETSVADIEIALGNIVNPVTGNRNADTAVSFVYDTRVPVLTEFAGTPDPIIAPMGAEITLHYTVADANPSDQDTFCTQVIETVNNSITCTYTDAAGNEAMIAQATEIPDVAEFRIFFDNLEIVNESPVAIGYSFSEEPQTPLVNNHLTFDNARIFDIDQAGPVTGTVFVTPEAAGPVTVSIVPASIAANNKDILAASTTFQFVALPLALEAVENRAFTVGDEIALTLPEPTGAIGPFTYMLFGPDGGMEGDPGLPDWLSFNGDRRTLTGTAPTTVPPDGGVTLSYVATDSSTAETEVMQTFTITVSELSLGEVENQTYRIDEEITPVTLPELTSGTEPFTYTLTGPEDASLGDTIRGLVFNADADSRTLSGKPEAVTPAGGVMLTYTATDSRAPDALTASLTFTVTVIDAVFNEVNNALLPEIARAMADSTTSAISRRIEQANLGQANLGQASLGQAGTNDGASVNIGGQSGLAEALTTHGKAVTEGERDFKTLLTGSDFVLPLAAVGNGVAGGGLSSPALWGSGEYRNLDNRHGSVSWDGNLLGAHAGIDGRLRQNLLLGMAVSWHQSDLDYKVDADDRGSHELSMISAHPYVGWNTNKLDLWATAGYGQGDLDITPVGGDKGSSDVNLLTAGMGLVSPLAQSDLFNLRTRGEVVWSQLEAEGSSTIDKLKVDTTRMRLTLEASRSYILPDGSRLEPTLEAGVRHDGGDGLTGSGFESGVGVRYHSPDSRVMAEGRSRILIGRSGDLDEWGIQGQILVTPDIGGQGFSFSLAPGYGDSNSTVQQVWRQDLADNLAGDNEGGADDYRMHLNTRLGYGFIMPGYNGVLTPYSEVAIGDAATYGLGMNWALASGVDLTLHGERREETNADAEHSILLKGAMRF